MPFFRKKPVVIEARQFLKPPAEDVDMREFLARRHDPVEIAKTDAEIKAAGEILLWLRAGGANFECANDAMGACILIDTLEGQMRADPGDWIIKGVKGEFYPCKPDIFEATYEVAG